ncbi:methyltransferase domain-containing protein [Bradyrhizobium guangzhouense]|uniref:methyltransferase domain-containing protein n=1 Tax=Bradyrhizobium guangzhouense TaxID=1325095 RepID=UPI001009B7BE|nr:class I SAM-dependent methyltransferase [Bradyrhizobium guangzhouense]RXH06467.1 class I SAM-dependent methyltransferase [Bradyrhizobium guangzhouense]
MHDTAYAIGSQFLANYAKAPCTVVEIGAMNVNGTLRDACPVGAFYVGLDVESGPGVDVVVQAGAAFPVKSEIADIVVASSVLEHDNFFWLTFLEMIRVLKPGGALYISAPSNGPYHRYPVDNWRFYPDCGRALETWADRNSCPVTLVESFTAERESDVWNDFVAIFVKGNEPHIHPICFLSESIRCTNVWRVANSQPAVERAATEDMTLIAKLRKQCDELRSSRSPVQAPPKSSVRFRWWPFRRSDPAPELIPHVSKAFPALFSLVKADQYSAERILDEIKLLLKLYISGWSFDERFYLETYADVAEAVRSGRTTSGHQHFLDVGYLEGRLPIDPPIDAEWYLKAYPDIAAALQKNLIRSARSHFIFNGYREGRLPSPKASRK